MQRQLRFHNGRQLIIKVATFQQNSMQHFPGKKLTQSGALDDHLIKNRSRELLGLALPFASFTLHELNLNELTPTSRPSRPKVERQHHDLLCRVATDWYRQRGNLGRFVLNA